MKKKDDDKVESEIPLNTSARTAKFNKIALESSMNQFLAERLAARFGEQIVHDCNGRLEKVEEHIAFVSFWGIVGRYMRTHVGHFTSAQVEVGDHFSCQITTSGVRALNLAPLSGVPDWIASKDIYNVKKIPKEKVPIFVPVTES